VGTTPGALAGLRVIDASAGIAGPLAAMFLADFDADVVKVELPGAGDARPHPGSVMWGRGKRRVPSLDGLVGTADVLITNARLDTGDVDTTRLVHLVVPALLDGAAWPLTIESEGLIAATTGIALRQASVGGGPIDSVSPILPTVHGVWAAAAAVAALIERQRSGLGQTVTVSGVHGAMVASSAAMNLDTSTEPPARVGDAGGSVPFYRTYQCGDGEWLFLAALTPRFTDLAFGALGVGDLYEDPRLDGRGRAGMLHSDNVSWVTERIAGAFLSDTREHWLAVLHAAGCPAGPVLARDDWLDHPQVEAIDMRLEVDDPERGPVVMPGVPLRLHATPGGVRPPVPSPAATAGGATTWLDRPWDLPPPTTPDATGTTPPLAGVRVLDLGAIIAGPYAASLLAELGASVVKVEPLTGDSFRGPGFAAYNKGQRGIAIDLQHPSGHDVLLRLVTGADIVIDNYRPGVLGRLNLGHERLSETNPQIISVSITGFGDGGPLGDEPGFDPVLQAMSGMMSAQGGDAEPVFFTVPVNDVTAAATTALGSLIALLHRVRTGQGQKVTTSLAAMSALVQADDIVRFAGRPPARIGGRDHRGAAPLDRYYEATDGWIRVLGTGTTAHPRTLEGLGLAAIDDEAIAAWVAGRSRTDAIGQLVGAGIAAVEARSTRELVDDETMIARGVLHSDPRPGRESRWTTGTYAHFGRSLLVPAANAPALGQHTLEILTEAGYTSAEVAELEQRGVLRRGEDPAAGVLGPRSTDRS
jgi:crotonobetainyl-CoA:carnitine CoA-transferase CaiB-like acyl-CoA transferase